MAWPGADVSTTNLDSDSDTPTGGAGASGREDLLALTQAVNLIRNHVSVYIRTLLDDADAAAARATLGLSLGSNAQAWDADLDALAALGSTGIAVRSAANTWVQRTLTGTANQITVTNGDGVSANPTISLPSAITLPGSLTMGGLLDLGSTGQIQFPATQNASAGANVFDDYEEGTFTVALIGGTPTYNGRSGDYTKAGRFVYISGFLDIGSLNSAANAAFGGLPFAAGGGPHYIGIVGMFGLATNIVSVAGQLNSGQSTVGLWSRTAASAADAQNAIFASAAALNFSGGYRV